MKKLTFIIFIFISLASSAQYYTNLGRNRVSADSLFVQHWFIYQGDTVLFPTYTNGRGYQIKNVDDPTDSLDAVNLRTMIDLIASHYDSISIDEGYFVRWSNSVRIDSVLLPSGMLDSVFVNITTDTLFIGGDTIISVAKYAGGGSENFIVASKTYVDSTAAAGGTYTDEQAQDAIGNILSDSGGIDFTYNDGVPSITASYTETDPIYASDSSNVVMFGDTITKIATKKDIESIHDPVTFAGTPDYITLSGQQITRNQIDLTTDVTGVLPDANVANNITLDNVTQITNRSHTSFSDIGINTHAQIDTHLGSTSNPHSVTATQTNITDAGDYYSSTNTNAALQEIGNKFNITDDSLAVHLDTLQAHNTRINANVTAISVNIDSLAVHTDSIAAISARTSGYVPYTGATSNVNLETYSLTTPNIIGGTATTSDLTLQTTSGVGATGADMHFLVGNNGATEAMTILNNGNVGIGTTEPTAVLHLKAGTATASTAPLKFTSGTLLTTPEAGAIEFLSDAYYGTITTGGERKQFSFTSDLTAYMKKSVYDSNSDSIINPTAGGTGQGAVAAGDLLIGYTTNIWSRLSAGESGTVLTSNGTTSFPTWETPAFNTNLVIDTLTGTRDTLDASLAAHGLHTMGSATDTIFIDNLVVGMTGNIEINCRASADSLLFLSDSTIWVSPHLDAVNKKIPVTNSATGNDTYSYWFTGGKVKINGTKNYE